MQFGTTHDIYIFFSTGTNLGSKFSYIKNVQYIDGHMIFVNVWFTVDTYLTNDIFD